MQFKLRTFSNDEALIKERRHQIVRCSTKVFCKKGYDSTNMRDLAKACGVSTGTLYHYFGSKEEILYSIIQSATAEQAEHIESSARELNSVAPVHALEQLMKIFYSWHDANQDTTLFVYQETKNLPKNARQDIFNSEARILTVFEEALRRCNESGELNISDPKLVSHNIATGAHMWALRRWFLRKNYDLETYVNSQVQIILKAFKPSKELVKSEVRNNRTI